MNVLIISHNPMNFEENNGRTIRNLFSNCDDVSVYQLFLHGGKPEADFCKGFYRITDFDIMNSFLRLKSPGNVLEKNDVFNNIESENKAYGKYSNKKPFIRFIRDCAWSINTWKTKRLRNWLRETDADVIFFYASDSVFSQRIAYWVKKYLRIPMMMYWVDDYYLKLKPNNLLDFVNQYFYKKISSANICNSFNVCITDAMAKAYGRKFKSEFEVLMNTTTTTPYKPKIAGKPLILSYLGNISLGRYESINTIGKMIYDNKLPIDFNVYSTEYRQEILNNIIDKPGVNFLGAVDYSEVKKIIENSDMVLHVESFSKENIDFCRYSLSTKIADSLMSNRCLLCYGPKEVASVDYLVKENCAIVATTPDELLSSLRRICSDTDLLTDTSRKALLIANTNHSVKENARRLKQYLAIAVQ